MEEKLDFRKGLKDGLPIGLGYIAPAIAISALYVALGIDKFFTFVFANGLNTISAMGALFNLFGSSVTFPLKYALIVVLVNCRYIFLSLTLGQKLDPNATIWQRMLFSFFNTDEIFGVAMQKSGKLPMSYMFGLCTLPYVLEACGLLLGVLLGDVLSESLKSALGIIIDAMFITIVVSSAKKSAPVANTVVVAIVISWAMEGILPQFGVKLEPSLVIFLCAMLSALFSAVIFPVDDEETAEIAESVPKEVD